MNNLAQGVDSLLMGIGISMVGGFYAAFGNRPVQGFLFELTGDVSVFASVWLLTTPDPARPAGPRIRTYFLRGVAGASILPTLLDGLAQLVAFPQWAVAASAIVTATLMLAVIPATFAILNVLREIALRTPNRKLAALAGGLSIRICVAATGMMLPLSTQMLWLGDFTTKALSEPAIALLWVTGVCAVALLAQLIAAAIFVFRLKRAVRAEAKICQSFAKDPAARPA